jgi:hypothetical protein
LIVTVVLQIQILTRLLEEYPDTLTATSSNENNNNNNNNTSNNNAAEIVLKSLSTLLQSMRNMSAKQHVLSACRALARCRDSCQESADWDLIFRTAFNMMSMNQAGPDGHQLFARLYPSKRALLPVEQVYSLFTNQLIKVTPDAVHTLRQCSGFAVD